MLKLHHLNIGRAIFTLWLVEELGAPYDLVLYPRDPATMRATGALRAVHPLGKSPVIEDGALKLAESGAITTYLIGEYGAGKDLGPPPSSDKARYADYLYWLHYPEGSAFLPLFMELLMKRGQTRPEPFAAYAAGEIPLHLAHMAAGLGQKDYILGAALSGADFGFAYIVSLAARLGLIGAHANLAAYFERVKARPAFQRAMDKSGENL